MRGFCECCERRGVVVREVWGQPGDPSFLSCYECNPTGGEGEPSEELSVERAIVARLDVYGGAR